MCGTTSGRVSKESYRTGDHKGEQNAQDKSPVTNPVRDERLFRSIACFFSIEVITNEKVRAETNAFPANEHQYEVIAQDQRQHRKHEEVEKGEESIETLLAMHVAN